MSVKNWIIITVLILKLSFSLSDAVEVIYMNEWPITKNSRPFPV